MKPFKTRIAVALSAALLMLAGSGAAALPSWRLPDLENRSIGPLDFQGQWVVVNYWATWCKPCREEMPALDDIDRRNENLTVLGVAWQDADVEELKEFLERVPVSYPVLRVDPFEAPPDIQPPRVLPTTLVFAPDGALAERFYGPIAKSDVQAVINRPRDNAGGDEP